MNWLLQFSIKPSEISVFCTGVAYFSPVHSSRFPLSLPWSPAHTKQFIERKFFKKIPRWWLTFSDMTGLCTLCTEVMNDLPILFCKYLHMLNHFACSTHGSSSSAQSFSPPSQWKHSTSSSLPTKNSPVKICFPVCWKKTYQCRRSQLLLGRSASGFCPEASWRTISVGRRGLPFPCAPAAGPVAGPTWAPRRGASCVDLEITKKLDR